jgi:phosphate transport system permease protein
MSATAVARPGASRGISPRGVIPRWGLAALYGATIALGLALAFGTGMAPAVAVVLLAIASGIALYVWSRIVEGRRTATDRLVTHAVTCAFLVAIAPLVSLLYTVVSKGLGGLSIDFFTMTQRNVIGEGGGAEHAILGTLIVTACATVVSVPVGVMAAIYLQE